MANVCVSCVMFNLIFNDMERVRLLLVVLFTSMFCNVKAETSVWDGYSYSLDWYTSGSGAVYHIKTAADLAGLSRCFSTGYYLYGKFEGRTIILDNDIDLAGYEWTPIGILDENNYYYEFAGAFDGNNHTIKGLSITKTTDNPYIKSVGLFGYCPFSESFSVKNLKVEGNITLKNVNLSSGSSLYVGGIVGYTGTSAPIENCQSNVNISVEIMTGDFVKANCGGIIGNISNSERTELCKNCYSKGNINVVLNNSNEARIGGIIGNLTCNNTIVSSCVSDCNITVSNGKSSDVGGIIGCASCKAVENSLFRGAINLEYPNYGLAGGIVGVNFDCNLFNSCLMTGQISKMYGTGWLSAISGTQSGTIVANNCYYLSGIPNSTPYGTAVSEFELKSGNPLNGFDESIWCFTQGEYPTLQFMKNTYTISVPTENGRIGFCVKEGGSATIQIDADDNWQLKAFYIDGYDYTGDVSNGRYTFSSVVGNHIISAVFEKDASGIRILKETHSPQIKIIDRNSIQVDNISSKTGIRVYDMNGKMILSKSVSSPTSIDLNTGLYIIKVGEQTFKVSL